MKKQDLSQPATKQDLEELKTEFKAELKTELKQYATKQDLKNELKQYATKQDLHVLENVMDLKFENQKKEIIEELEEKAQKRHFELMNLFSDLAGEVKDSRDERALSGLQISENRQRIEKLEKDIKSIKQRLNH